MNQKLRLARLMKMSWSIQKDRRLSRSASLTNAWVILINEDIAISYLIEKMSKGRKPRAENISQFSIFNAF